MDNVSRNNKVLIQIREILFFVPFGLFLIKLLFCDVTLWNGQNEFLGIFDQKVDMLYDSYLPCVLLVCIAFAFFTSVPEPPKIIACVALIVIGKFVSIANENIYFYVFMLLIVAAYGISAKKILLFSLFVNLPLWLFTIVSSQIGKIENRIDPSRNREYLGYNWTTTPVMIFSYAVFAYLIIRKGKINIWEYLTLNVANYWFFHKTNTRFAFLIIFLLLSFLMIYRLFREDDRHQNMFKTLFVLIPSICFVVVYTVTELYTSDSGIMVKLNNILSKRLSQCQYALSKYGFKPFGQPITWVTIGQSTPDNPATYVDTAYLQTLLKFGYVSLIALLLISTYILWRSFKCKGYSIAIVFACILVFGLFEQQPFWLEYDVILLLLFADWSHLLEVPQKTKLSDGIISSNN